MNRPASLVAALFMIGVACVQILRILFGVEVRIGGVQLPYWANAVAACILASLAGWLLKERARK